MLTTKHDLVKLSSPAQSPQYLMTIPARTRCELIDGKPVVADTTRVIGGNRHDLAHYYIWLDPDDVVNT